MGLVYHGSCHGYLLIKAQVNMGNIHFKTGQYNKAIKYYRMALDQV